MTLRLGGDGAITGCTSLENPDLTVSGLTISGSFDAEKVLVASGTAAAPSYTFSGDTDNGLYYAGTNSIGLATAGTNAILIDSSGRVGISSTSNPTVKLHVIGSGAQEVGIGSINAGGATLYLDGDADGNIGGGDYAFIRHNTDGDLNIVNLKSQVITFNGSSLVEKVRIDSSGRLLVGATSGTELLEVHGDTPVLKLRDTSDYVLETGPQIYFQGKDSNEAIKNFAIIRGQSNGADNGELTFWTRLSGSSLERMRIDRSGNIGIGTTSPTFLGSGFKEVIVSGATEGAGLQLQDTDGNVKAGLFTSDVSGAAFIRTITNHPLAFRTNNTERMRILSTGGLTFNGDTATANALDDYEEGTWTPALSNGGSPSYSAQLGGYIKIGGALYLNFFLSWSGATASSSTRISGLPFSVTDSSYHVLGWASADNTGGNIYRLGTTGLGTTLLYYYLATQNNNGIVAGTVQITSL